MQRELHAERREERREDRQERREEQHLAAAERRDERREIRDERRDDLLNNNVDDNIVFHPTHTTKILVSPGTGAGWITYAPRQSSDAFLAWMLCYQPLIKALERRDHKDKLEDLHREFHHQAHMKFGIQGIVCARVGDLVVEEVRVPFEVLETEGRERIVEVNRRSLRRNIVI